MLAPNGGSAWARGVAGSRSRPAAAEEIAGARVGARAPERVGRGPGKHRPACRRRKILHRRLLLESFDDAIDAFDRVTLRRTDWVVKMGGSPLHPTWIVLATTARRRRRKFRYTRAVTVRALRSPASRRTTIADIARQTQVSVATVSKVI